MLLSQINHPYVKFAGMVILAAAVFIIYRLRAGKPGEKNIFLWGIAVSFLFKIFAAVTIYSLLPDPSQFLSDAANYYYPDTHKLLSGLAPYRDFDTRYSPFFLPLMALSLSIWDSIASIVLTMIAIELAAIWLYIRYFSKTDVNTAYRTAFLYSLSPVSMYWIGVVGYNAIIITFFIMLAVIAADRKRDLLSGLAAAGSFLFCKLLALLAWPGILFFRKKGIISRSIFPVLSIVFTLGLLLFGIDSLNPIKKEFGNYTAGNIWYIIAALHPQFLYSQIFKVLPIICFGTAFAYLFLRYLKKIDFADSNFDTASAFIGASFLLFMIFSRKTYNSYHPMMLIFIIHPLIKANYRDLPVLLALTFLGAVSYIDVKLFEVTKINMSFSNPNFIVLFIIDVILVPVNMFLFYKLHKTLFLRKPL